MTDPYTWPESNCLKNKLGIHDAAELALSEGRIVAIREFELIQRTLPGEYNLEHLMAFHGRLFGDVYEWAGKTRTVDISKQYSLFCRWEFIDEQVSTLLAGLDSDDWFFGLNRDSFITRLTHYYSELNVIHPFREGNGRTQRAFFRQLAAAAGWALEWSQMNEADNIKASQASLLSGDEEAVRSMLDRVTSRL